MNCWIKNIGFNLFFWVSLGFYREYRLGKNEKNHYNALLV